MGGCNDQVIEIIVTPHGLRAVIKRTRYEFIIVVALRIIAPSVMTFNNFFFNGRFD